MGNFLHSITCEIIRLTGGWEKVPMILLSIFIMKLNFSILANSTVLWKIFLEKFMNFFNAKWGISFIQSSRGWPEADRRLWPEALTSSWPEALNGGWPYFSADLRCTKIQFQLLDRHYCRCCFSEMWARKTLK